MKPWSERPREEAYLLNPAFCSTTIASALYGYSTVKEGGIPFSLAFIVLPLVLHKSTREALPPSVRTSLPAWLQQNPSARILFYERLVSLKPYTKEAIQYGLLYDRIVLTDEGNLSTGLTSSDINRTLRTLQDEARECVLRARFVGKWFASVGSPSNVMAFWGIRP